MDNKTLIKAALTAMKKSYSPYSNCTVGAALLTKSGKIYTGCNIENAAFSPTVCAERVAFFKAISDGESEFSKIAVTGGKRGEVKELFVPCGVCRQVMTEFCEKDFEIITAKNEDDYTVNTLEQLLPHSFSSELM